MEMFRLPKRIESLIPREGKEQRGFGRMRVDEVRCSLGRLLDLSMSGCQIRRSSAPKKGEMHAPRCFWIETPTGGRLEVRGTLVRHAHAGFRKHELGYAFTDLTTEQRETLCEIARCSIRFEMGFGDRAA